MKKNSHLIIVGIAGTLLACLLFFLPRTVVKDKSDTMASRESSGSTNEDHMATIELSPEVKSSLEQKRDSLNNERGNRTEILLSISSLFQANNLFDSAGYYTNIAAKDINSIELVGQAADQYFQAYSLSLDPVYREKLAEKTRELYDLVLKQSPRDLHARTNKAMTFVTSEAPMQAIMLLRQVLDDEPRYIPALMSIGALSMQSGQYDKAVQRFEEVLKIDPNNVRGKLGLAYSLLETDQKKKGEDILQSILKEEIDEVLRNEIENTLKNIKK
ncbi:Tetratricopeptide repeat-containing protein [Spirosomataceae bacterium TFI 002]|nr:Tetratricopeptide repeat-containing protein [Spirosomataceae bacterium TFI 002]